MFGKTQTYGSLMQDPLRLFTAAGNKKPKWSLSGYDTASGAVFAWCFLVMGQQRGKRLALQKGMALENTPQNFMEGQNELQPVITTADICLHSPNAPFYP